MELSTGKIVEAEGSVVGERSRWRVVELLQSTRHQHCYLVANERPDLDDQRAQLTICRYNPRLLDNQRYVDNVRRRLLHQAELLTAPLNLLPEPVDLFQCQNSQEKFTFGDGARYHTDEPVLVTELYSGEPLDRLQEKTQTLTEARVVGVALQLCDLLTDLHHHRLLAYELRPEELLIDGSDHDRVWVRGCGNYQRLDRRGRIAAAELVVPLTDFTFAAPEVEAGSGTLDARADIYSLGAVVLYLLTGAKARELRSAGAAPTALPKLRTTDPALRTFLDTCMQSDPRARYADPEQARAALLLAVPAQSAGAGSRPTPLPRREPPPARRGLWQRLTRWLVGS